MEEERRLSMALAASVEEITKAVQCSICMSDLRDPKRTLGCNHFFCSYCVGKLFTSRTASHKCPLCNTPLKTKRSLVMSEKLGEIVKRTRALVSSFDADTAALAESQGETPRAASNVDPYEHNVDNEQAVGKKPQSFRRSARLTRQHFSVEPFISGSIYQDNQTPSESSQRLEDAPAAGNVSRESTMQTSSSCSLFEPASVSANLETGQGSQVQMVTGMEADHEDFDHGGAVFPSLPKLPLSFALDVVDFALPEDYDHLTKMKVSSDDPNQLPQWFKPMQAGEAIDFEVPQQFLTTTRLRRVKNKTTAKRSSAPAIPDLMSAFDCFLTQPMNGRSGRPSADLAPDSELVAHNDCGTSGLLDDQSVDDLVPDSTSLCPNTSLSVAVPDVVTATIKTKEDIQNWSLLLMSKIEKGNSVEIEAHIVDDGFEDDTAVVKEGTVATQLLPSETSCLTVDGGEMREILDDESNQVAAGILLAVEQHLLQEKDLVGENDERGGVPGNFVIEAEQQDGALIENESQLKDCLEESIRAFQNDKDELHDGVLDEGERIDGQPEPVGGQDVPLLDKTLEFNSECDFLASAISNVDATQVLDYRCMAAVAASSQKGLDSEQRQSELTFSPEKRANDTDKSSGGDYQDCLSQPPIISSIVSRLTGDDRLDVLQPGLTQDIFSSADDRNNLSIAPSKIVFCLSRILPDKILLNRFIDLFGAEYRDSFSSDVTHVIVSANLIDKQYYATHRTLSYYLAIASRKWIVGQQWVEESIRLEQIQDPERFEIIGDEEHKLLIPPRRDRLVDDPLFLDTYFYVYGTALPAFKKGDYERLVLEAGGQIAHSIADLRNRQKAGVSCFIVANPAVADRNKEIEASSKNGLLPVKPDWLLESISSWDFSYYIKKYFDGVPPSLSYDGNESPAEAINVSIDSVIE